MGKRYIWLLGLLMRARLVHANDLGPLAPLAPIGAGILAFLAIVAAIVVFSLGIRAFNSYRNRDMGGMGEVMENVGITVMAGIFFSVVIYSLIDPLTAKGAIP